MADGAADACICVLLYGAEEKHFQLAQRVLNEPMRCLAKRNIEFRFGCNAVGDETRAFLGQQIADYFNNALVVDRPENILKYPIMRHMFYDTPISAPFTIWFDHDSYLSPELDASNWLDRVVRQFNCCDMHGSLYRGQLSPEQDAWAAKQPWFNADAHRPYMSYALGGWWAIKTELLLRWNWPPEDFKQKNGDLILGALFQHQNLKLCHFRDDVHINVNDSGVEGASLRAAL